MIRVLITMRAGEEYAEVRSPFAARDVIKSIPGSARKWDKDHKRWLVQADYAGQLADTLRSYGYVVDIIRPEQPQPPAVTAPGTGAWADLLYAGVGPDLGDKLYRVLAPILHPDTGGHTGAMQSLNRARDRAHGRNTRRTP